MLQDKQLITQSCIQVFQSYRKEKLLKFNISFLYISCILPIYYEVIASLIFLIYQSQDQEISCDEISF